MADAIKVNVYKIGNSINTKLMGFPVISSEFSATPSGQIRVGDVDCYGLIAFNGNQHYVKETVAELVTLANAGGGGGGSVESVSGLNTDNTDPANPVVAISVDGSTITGAGTPGDPLVAAGGASYLVYTALLTQTGTDAPVATVLQNTLGGTVVWTRDSEGSYTGTLAAAFPANKVIFPAFADPNYYSNIPIGDYKMLQGRNDNNTIGLSFQDNLGDPVEMVDVMGSDPVQVIVYVYP